MLKTVMSYIPVCICIMLHVCDGGVLNLFQDKNGAEDVQPRMKRSLLEEGAELLRTVETKSPPGGIDPRTGMPIMDGGKTHKFRSGFSRIFGRKNKHKTRDRSSSHETFNRRNPIGSQYGGPVGVGFGGSLASQIAGQPENLLGNNRGSQMIDIIQKPHRSTMDKLLGKKKDHIFNSVIPGTEDMVNSVMGRRDIRDGNLGQMGSVLFSLPYLPDAIKRFLMIINDDQWLARFLHSSPGQLLTWLLSPSYSSSLPFSSSSGALLPPPNNPQLLARGPIYRA